MPVAGIFDIQSIKNNNDFNTCYLLIGKTHIANSMSLYKCSQIKIFLLPCHRHYSIVTLILWLISCHQDHFNVY